MSNSGKGLGDIILANNSEKIDYALGALSWHGAYLITQGVLGLFGLDKRSRDLKKLEKWSENIPDYSCFMD